MFKERVFYDFFASVFCGTESWLFYIWKGSISDMGQSGAVYDISTGMLGPVGGILAIVGVIACPITSGDTAYLWQMKDLG